VSLQYLFSVRSCKTVVIVCSDHTVIDRLCVKRRLGALVSSLWLVLVQKHICVLGLFYLVSDIFSVFIDYHYFPMLFVRFT